MGQRGITDLARCGSCGIPSAWRSPTTRRPRGSPRRNRCVCHVALPLGCRVVALGGGRRDAPPCPPRPSRSDSCCPAIPEACPPGEGVVWSGLAAFAVVRAGLVDVGWHRVVGLVPICRG
jgi:hypothetical protein